MAMSRSAPLIVALLTASAAPALAQYLAPQTYQVPYNAPIQSAPLAPPSGSPSAPPAGIGTQPAPPPTGAARQQPPPGAPRPGARDQFPGPVTATPPAAGTASPAGAPGADTDAMVVQPPTEKIPNPTAVYAGLDKITGRITSFEVGLGETVQFGALQVTPRACYTRPPTEPTNTTSFTEVNEITLKGEAKRIFTGWMFASSPGLHGVEHPIFDVWLTDCKAVPPSTGKSAGQK
ncbi:DUF2155 domain-containing protein [Aquabacter cavernae]|uniref:DUF2155 domain-containing protein n=1 Tax=Aquabacter cavernae TaxID=2496029 RepID=UPI0030841A90